MAEQGCQWHPAISLSGRQLCCAWSRQKADAGGRLRRRAGDARRKMASRESLRGVLKVLPRKNCVSRGSWSSIRQGQICSVAHRREKTECVRQFSYCLFPSANADVEGNTLRHRSDTHNLGEEFASAVPRRGIRVLKRDFQLITYRVLPLTPKP